VEAQMMIDFTPEQEQALDKAARRQGTTPELLVMSAVERLLAPVDEDEEQRTAHHQSDAEIPVGGSLADRLAYYIGAIDSGERVPGGARLSERTGVEYGKLLLKRHREGYP
jgi:hypothetical protein